MKKPLTFIFRQKINFILHIFFEILQRYCKFVILGTLGMPGYAHPKWYYRLVENFRVYLQTKIQLHPLRFGWDIAKLFQTYYFGYFGHVWLRTPRVILSTCRKLLSLSACKNLTSSFTFSMRYCKDIVNLLFWVFCTCLAAQSQNDSIKS